MRWWRQAAARLGVRTAYGRDALAAAVLAVLGLTRLLVAHGGDVALPYPVWALAVAYLLATADLGAVAVRRRFPRTALATATVLPLAGAALPTRAALIGLGAVVCAYTVATVLPRRTATVWVCSCLAVHLTGGLVLVAAGGDVGGLATFWGVTRGDVPGMTVAAAAAYLVPWLAGSYVRLRREQAAEDAARLAREQEERARAAVREERARIARELHDIAAHDLSAMVVQAGAADRLLDHDPAAVRATLRAIREQGRETLAALRGLVSVMRDDGGDRSGWPALARLDDYVDRARGDGLRVELVTRGERRPLPPVVDLAASRVIQEALTNAGRHAPGAAVTVTMVYDEQEVRVRVRNTAADAPVPAGPGGYGLLGMRERVQHAGGGLTVGPLGTGGWQVEARFPAGGAGPP